MYKFSFSIGLVLLLALPYFSQIEELKSNADKARKVLGEETVHPKNKSKTLFVNPFIGTGGHGHTYPGASAPFGMMQLSPDTRYDGWDGCGGYHYNDSIIYGFSHTHLSGTGVSDYADLLICPQVGSVRIDGKYKDPNGYGHRFSHDKESAAPGFYSVELLDAKIRAEFTADVHSGLHKYTFNGPNENKYILLDLDYRDELISADFKVIGKNKLHGHRISRAWAEEQHFYFYLESNVDWRKAKIIRKKGRNKLVLQFPKNTKEIILRVGISAVDTAGAKKNLETEIDGFDFIAHRSKINRMWEKELSKIYFHSDEKDINTIFYTALYHSFLNPNTFSDVDGRYRGMDKAIHQLTKKEDKQFTVFSLWDTFRATHPLFTLVQREKTGQFIRTFERMDKEQKDLPVWELAGNETECMIGYHSVSVIADAYINRVDDFDAHAILAAMIRTAKDSAYSKDFYTENGYLSLEKEPESVSKILEYAYDDYCIAMFAIRLGENEIAKEFLARSFNFINHFDPTTKFFRARRGGMWMSPFQPDEVNFNYTEANAWQYSLFAPHAIGTLMTLHGGKEGLEKHLDAMFNAPSSTSGRDQADITGLIGQYAHGNEPSHHMAYLYNYVNRSDKAQFYLDSIMRSLYANDPDGLSGNEDCGQMSSWYVLSALGLYNVSPGSGYFNMGRPMMKEAIIYLENGKTLEFEVINQTPENKYVQSVLFNGRNSLPLIKSIDEILYGGKLTITMGPTPNENVTNFSHPPTYFSIPPEFTPIPFFKNENRVFEGELLIDASLTLPEKDYSIEYRFGKKDWKAFTKPFTIQEDVTIYLRTKNNLTNQYSTIVSSDFVKKNQELQLNLMTTFTLPYAASGEFALIDGIKGNEEFRTGDWQGFYGKDVQAEIQFKTAKSDFTVEIGMLEDLKSWIFYPESISLEVSTDGVNYTKYSSEKLNLVSNTYRRPGTHRKTVQLKVKDPVKAIRLQINNPGNCPDWHLGKGYPSWIFLDEITIK